MSIDNTAQLTLFSLILMRMSGFILMNPILGRNNIPVRVKGGFIFILTMTVYSASMEEAIEIASTVEFGFLLFKEFAAGYVIGSVDGHLALMKILLTSAEIVPYGGIVLTQGLALKIIDIFLECVGMGVRLAIPMIAAEFLVEMGVGILNKVVPQISIFVINIQMKLIVGLGLLALLYAPAGEFIEKIMTTMIKTVQGILTFL